MVDRTSVNTVVALMLVSGLIVAPAGRSPGQSQTSLQPPSLAQVVTDPDTAPPSPVDPPSAGPSPQGGWWLAGLGGLGLGLGLGVYVTRRQARPSEAELPPPSPEQAPPVALSPTADATATTHLATKHSLEELVSQLTSVQPSDRRQAIWELAQRGHSGTVQPLVNGLLTADSQEKSLILAALTEISSRGLKPLHQALALSLQDPSPEVRKNAIRDLSRLYDSLIQLSHVVAHATEDPHPDVQDTAQWALEQLNQLRPPPLSHRLPSPSDPPAPP